MTEYLDKCEAIGLSKSFQCGALFYIFEKFHSNPNLASIEFERLVNNKDENMVQLLFNMSPVKLRIYGSVKELTENLKIYMSFPGSHLYFRSKHAPYVMTPILYENLKNETFICKLDLFPVLQSMLARSFQERPIMIIMFMVIPMLKFEEKRLKELPEFVKFDQKVLDEIWKEIQNAQIEIKRRYRDGSFYNLLKMSNGLSVHELFKKLQDYVPNNWDDVDITSIFAFFGLFVQKLRHEDRPNTSRIIAIMFVQAKILCETIQNVIDARPEMFRLHSETRKGPITVRMFEDAGHRFVMKMELFNALRESSEGAIQIDYTDFHHKYDTMRMEDVLKEYRDEIKNIEFIRYPIKRAKHRAVPVNGPDSVNPNRFCILAVDLLFEVLRSLIFEYQLFQRNEQEFAWSDFSDFMDIFFQEATCPYFLKNQFYQYIKKSIEENFKEPKTVPKNVRNAKKDGFTLQSLKNELEYLGLTVVIPEIQDHAEIVYEHVNRVKKERFLRTCDLFDAIEQCQLICIFERLPNLKKFLHNQGGCGRVFGLKCHLCMDQQKTSENQKPQKLQASDTTLPAIESSTSNALESSSEIVKKEMEDKLSRLEQELLQKTQENEKLHVANIKLTAENETKSGIIDKLMNKLSIEASSKSSVTVVEKPIPCLICQGEIEGQMTIDCPMCSTKFHKKCALQYGQHQTKCPACKGEIVKFIC